MRVFKEEQAFRQWWLIAILGSTLIASLIPFYDRNGTSSNLQFIVFFLVVLIIFLFWTVRLRTRIDAKGITTSFSPTRIFRRYYNWNEISKCYVREYSPIREYGGWGVRGFGTAKAYNVSGRLGIQIITKDQKKFLIGTNKPEEAAKVISRYQNKTDEK